MDEDTKTKAMHWQNRGPGFHTTVAGLSSALSIMVDQEFNARALRAGRAAWLRALEREGITETGRWDSSRIYLHPVTNALVAAGVLLASAVTGPPAGVVDLAYASGIPSRPAGDPNHITEALTEALAVHVSDAAKLDRSGVLERHLFMWVDPLTRLDIGRALTEGVPTAAPVVDPRISTVWLGIPAGPGVEVLRWSPAAGWRYDKVAL